ncbi:hypothetical protein D6D04_03999 [Aureobasidium pullulans]|nr:hypothetical protein D6D04_03999 [Aureobasidium pullulans]
MQQFKLAAGLQTMCFMLLAAKAWPGTQLPEHKGNPLVHDVLDGLGLLEHKDGQDIDFGSDEHEIDTQYSSAEGVLSMEHPKHDHDAVQASPIPPAVHTEESQRSRLQLEQCMLSQFPENESNLDRAIGPSVAVQPFTRLFRTSNSTTGFSIEATVQEGSITSKQSSTS